MIRNQWVYVNYCEESSLMNPRCQKLSELDAKTAEMDKKWYEKRDPKTEKPTKIAKIYVTVYYAEKGEQMLHHFKKSIDIGNGHGGIVSQLKYDNEMKLTDEYWINYQKGKGSEEFQKYMGRSDGYAESCASISAELLQLGRKRCEGETRTADSGKK